MRQTFSSLLFPLPLDDRSSVFIDPEQTHSMKLRQLGEKDTKKGACVDQEVSGIVFGVKAGQHVPKREQTSWWRLQ